MEKNLSGNSPHRTAITIYKYKVYMTRFEIRWKASRMTWLKWSIYHHLNKSIYSENLDAQKKEFSSDCSNEGDDKQTMLLNTSSLRVQLAQQIMFVEIIEKIRHYTNRTAPGFSVHFRPGIVCTDLIERGSYRWEIHYSLHALRSAWPPCPAREIDLWWPPRCSRAIVKKILLIYVIFY